jgi:YHS domain-containing protein
MLGLLQKHCPVCGMDVDKNTTLKRFGKYFCSEDHASQYAKMRITREAEDDRRYSGGGGCC